MSASIQSGNAGRAGGEDQEQEERAAELVPEDSRPRRRALLTELVEPVLPQPARGLGRREAAHPGPEPVEDLIGRQRPVRAGPERPESADGPTRDLRERRAGSIGRVSFRAAARLGTGLASS